MFFDCYFAHFVWNIFITFGAQPPSSIPNLFGSWINAYPSYLKNQILVEAAALLWAMWLNRNDIVFNKAKSINFLQVIFNITYWIRTWLPLHKDEGVQKKTSRPVAECWRQQSWRFLQSSCGGSLMSKLLCVASLVIIFFRL